ncbi:MAG: glycosyl hydrolase family 18 protein [Defluviitaleaceae bacterium]|nr:glycosyl hydrolase family 18 protein [Defluviitaleaceae bacterium]
MAVRRFLSFPFMQSGQVIDFHIYSELDPNITGIIIEDEMLKPDDIKFLPALINGAAYLPVSFVRSRIDPFLFWDAYDETLFLSSDTDIRGFKQNSDVRIINGQPYVSLSFVSENYRFDAEYIHGYNMVVLTDRALIKISGELQGETDIRYRPENRAPIAKKSIPGEKIFLYEQEGSFTRVRTSDGLLGYVKTSLIKNQTSLSPSYEMPDINYSMPHEKINMMWDILLNIETPAPEGVNVISPVWFTFDTNEKKLVSRANHEYIEWARSYGMQIWPMLADSSGENASALLTDANARSRIIIELCNLAEEFGFDGINIDLEHVREADAGYYIQFIRELAVAARQNNLILSVDMYVPSPWSSFYRRDLIGLTVDFICLMTYDEHYSGSSAAGPVASLRFVEKGVTDMLLEVPKEKILMGVPFYNRIWIENDSVKVAHHYGMDAAKEFMEQRGALFEWDEIIGSYYGECISEDETGKYRLWLEDPRSIEAKLSIYKKYDLAGIAGWRRGFENEAAREIINKNLN